MADTEDWLPSGINYILKYIELFYVIIFYNFAIFIVFLIK